MEVQKTSAQNRDVRTGGEGRELNKIRSNHDHMLGQVHHQRERERSKRSIEVSYFSIFIFTLRHEQTRCLRETGERERERERGHFFN